jgi:subfamily B ATP-binding cassette protein MsbA
MRFLRYVLPYKRYVIGAALGGIVKFTVPLLVPQITRHLLDDVYLNPALGTPDKLRELFMDVGGMIAIFVFFWAPFTYMRHYCAGKAGQRSMFDLRCDLYDRILAMSTSFFDRNKSGTLVSRLISDVELAQNIVGNALTNVWMDTAALALTIYFLLRIDVAITFVALMTFPFYLYFFRRIQRDIKASTHEVQEELARMSGELQEKIAGNRVVHAFTQEQTEHNSFLRESETLFSKNMHRVRLQSTNSSISGILVQIAPLIVALYGGYRVIMGHLTVGELVAVGMYLAPLYLPLERFSDLNVVIANSLASLERIFDVMDEEPDVRDRPNAVELQQVRGEVAFDHVHFAYHNIADDSPVLRDVNFKVDPGQKVALVGPSGAGKSTIVSLIPRFYDVEAGAVRVDNQDIRQMTVKSLRRHIGIVLQNPILFSGTIRENILYGKPDSTEDEIIAAAKAANAYDFICAFPKGLDTEVGEGGGFLSGGQRQRITLARAFLKDPKILILDEATSSLDAESERLVQSALERLMVGRTTFIIAHRLSTIINADWILVLQKGAVVESGTHSQLLQQDGTYHRLYQHVS